MKWRGVHSRLLMGEARWSTRTGATWLLVGAVRLGGASLYAGEESVSRDFGLLQTACVASDAAPAATSVTAKTGSVFFPSELVARVRANARDHAWAAQTRASLVAAAQPWMELSDEDLWGLMFGNTIRRSWQVWSNGYCCPDIEDQSGYGVTDLDASPHGRCWIGLLIGRRQEPVGVEGGALDLEVEYRRSARAVRTDFSLEPPDVFHLTKRFSSERSVVHCWLSAAGRSYSGGRSICMS